MGAARPPMSQRPTHCAVMFADVVNSTGLYETLGDDRALALIQEAIDTMSEIAGHHGGTVIKTIGDEVMCRFDSADAAARAACAIQEAMNRRAALPGVWPLAIRIGLEYGEAVPHMGDLFGDAVNVAARMAGIATAERIITTWELVSCLSEDVAGMAREYDQEAVKGRREITRIYEIVWSPQNATRIPTVPASVAMAAQKLRLRYQARERWVLPETSGLVIGRDPGCDMCIDAETVSRRHARIAYRRGKFVLVDQSTNGSFVRDQRGAHIYLKREELPLAGEGVIGIGAEITDEGPHIIHFTCL